ncbi:MAG: Omp28-related outer membrane protein [Flavobacteriales bacterium]
MKKIAFILFTAALLFSCKKEDSNTNEDKNPAESLPSSFVKRVLLEDYSKHCQFCIPLNSKVDSMRGEYPNNSFIPVIIGANHSTQIEYFDTINKFFNVTTTPSGGVNRVPAVNSGTQTGKLIYLKEHWATNVDAEITKSTDFGLKMSSSLSGSNLDLEVSIGSFSANNELKLTVFVIEDDQYYRTLREVITNYKGDNLSLESNSMIKKSFSGIDLNGLNLSKTSIVAFVHYFDEATKDFKIENAQEIKAGESVSW